MQRFDSLVFVPPLRYGNKRSLTFEPDLKHFIGILDDVTVRPESVARTMHADLQAKVGLWWRNKSSGM